MLSKLGNVALWLVLSGEVTMIFFLVHVSSVEILQEQAIDMFSTLLAAEDEGPRAI